MATLTISRRYPWLAAVLSLIMPGLGQIYCGAFARGLIFVLLSDGAGLLAVLSLARLATPGVAVLWIEGGAAAFYVWGVIDARRLASRTTADYVVKEYNRWYVYVMLYLAVSGGHLFSALYVRDHLVQPFRAGSTSMYPTIWKGDQVLAEKNVYVKADPVPGDLVIFANPNDRSQAFVKRVVGVAGDVIEMHGHDVLINGRKLEHVAATAPAGAGGLADRTYVWETNRGARYLVLLAAKNRPEHDLPPFTVPAHTCFVLGDNREASLDSRSFGPIPITSIIGRVEFRYAPLARIGTVEPVHQ